MPEPMERVRSEGAGRGAAELAAWVSGPVGAPVVVLVHGFPDTHAVWDGVTLRLARVKPHVLAVLRADGVVERIGADHIHGNVHLAVEAQLADARS